MRLHRSLLSWPDPEADAGFADTALLEAQVLLAARPAIGPRWRGLPDCTEGAERPDRASRSREWQPLWHALSEAALKQSRRSRFCAGRVDEEARLCTWLTARLATALADETPDAFVALVEASGHRIIGCGFRTRDVGLARGAAGDHVVFPPASGLGGQFRELHGFLRRHRALHPLASAVVAMVAATNSHPFRDGNGRFSRLLFNALLRLSLCPQADYLPLYALFWQCGCGYEIRVREAEITGHWRPLLAFMGRLLCMAVTPATGTADGPCLDAATC